MSRYDKPYPTSMVGRYHRDHADIVIVGNGIAGLTAALESRRLAPHLGIVVITEQSHPTVNTPSLKQFLVGKLKREQLLAYPAGTEREQDIQVIYGRVEAIDAQSKSVYLNDGFCLGYTSLLIATGSVATGLSAHLPGYDFDGVLVLHRLRDYLDLRRRLHEVDEAVVIGSGAHAAETVASLIELDISVHWLIRGKTALSHTLDQSASDMLLQHVRAAGAKVYTETEVLGIVGRVGVVAGIIDNRREMIPCQVVLVCTGTAPVTALAEHCNPPMLHDHGILVDNQLRTSVPGVYAAGDVAALKNPQTGNYETRRQWYAAVEQGRTAAAVMTGQDTSMSPPFGVPWHATRLGKLAMLTVGGGWTGQVTTLIDKGRDSYRRMSVSGDRLVGYLSLGPAHPDGFVIKHLIDEARSIRDIRDALLKGTLDAHTYFSQRCARAIYDMMTTESVPTRSEPAIGSPATAYPSHQTDPLTPLPGRSNVGKPPYSETIHPTYTPGYAQSTMQPGKTRTGLPSYYHPALPKTIGGTRLIVSPRLGSNPSPQSLWSYVPGKDPLLQEEGE